MIYRFRRIAGGNVVPEDEDTQAAVNKLKPGEVLHGKFTKQRDIVKHRRYFALMNHAFEHWEPKEIAGGITPQKNFDQFRADVTIMAGYYVANYRVDGSLLLVAKSISFANMKDDEFERVYSNTINVILEHILTQYTREDLDKVVEEVLRFT